MKPLDITSDNKAIGPEGGIPGISCGCGGKNKGQCGSKKDVVTGNCATDCATDCGCGPNCRCRKKSCCTFLMTLWVLLGAGALAFTGWSIGCAIHQLSTNNNVVSVRGFAEREVKADLAIWNIGFVATGGDIAEVQAKVEKDGATLQAFLQQAGIAKDEIIELPTSMVDLLSRDYRSEGAAQNRYIVNGGLRVRTAKVDVVKDLSGLKIGALIKSGVTLKEGQPPVYLYTKLKDIKPPMVAEATADAKAAAMQFARDSGARLGGMKWAQQGVFQFLPRDQADSVTEATEIDKTVRVVTTAGYLLED